MEKPANVLMEREGQQAEVANNASVQIMEALGWTVVAADPDAANKPADLTAAQIKEQLTAKGIEFKGNASKADLQALLDAASKPADPV